jgi:FkbM family methyltransferase
LGNRTGISRLHIQDLTPGAALHTESSETLMVTRTHKPVIWREGISTFTLDAFCEETGLTPQSLKMDVDGTEREILEGAQRTLRSPSLRSLLVEMFGGPDVREACAQLLLAAGLRQVWSDPARSDNEIWARPST